MNDVAILTFESVYVGFLLFFFIYIFHDIFVFLVKWKTSFPAYLVEEGTPFTVYLAEYELFSCISWGIENSFCVYLVEQTTFSCAE